MFFVPVISVLKIGLPSGLSGMMFSLSMMVTTSFVPLIILICSCWTFSIGLAYFLSIRCKMGLVGLWIGLSIDESIRAIVTYIRWKRGKWKYTKV